MALAARATYRVGSLDLPAALASYSAKRSASAHTFVYQNCDWSKVWGSAAPSTAIFCTTLLQATQP